METTVGQLLLNEALPADLRDYERTLDKAGIKKLFAEVADKYPQQYSDISHKFHNLAREVATTHGGSASLNIEALRTPAAVKAIHAQAQGAIDKILAGPFSQEQKDREVVKIVSGIMDSVTKTNYEEGLREKNPFALQVLSGSRGNANQFRSLRGGALLVADHKDDPIPIPIMSSYSEGLDPVQYWASTYGARKGEIAKKFCLFRETLVRMSDGGVKEIQNIEVGDLVLGSDRFGNVFPVKVLNVFNNGRRRCFKYDFFFNGTGSRISLVATRDHGVLSTWRSSNAWAMDMVPKVRPLRMAKLGHNRSHTAYTAVAPGGFELVNGKHEQHAWLIGWLLGDGNMTDRSLTVSAGEPLILSETEELVRKAGFKLVRTCETQYSYNFTEAEPRANKHNVRHPFKKKLEEEGYWGKKAHQKSFAADIDLWSNESVATVLAGLFSADSSIASNKKGNVSIRLALTSDALVRKAQELLACRFGIYGNYKDFFVNEGSANPVYGLSISNRACVEKFAKCIPLLGKKRQDLETALRDVVPKETRTVGFRFAGYEPAGHFYTYDLEVDHPDHLFVLANGLIVSNSSPKAGFLGKQLAMAAHRMVVTEADCGASSGIPVAANEADNEGAVLAQDVGKFKANSVITIPMLKEMGDKKILVRSPITCQAKQGVCQKCSGLRESGNFPKIGDNVGISAATALSEQLTQSTMNVRHGGGQFSNRQHEGKSGLDLINQLVEVPKTFHGAAAVASKDGLVEAIEAAPQGGQYIHISGAEHWVPPETELKVKKGDSVEAGDVLSGGTPNPAEIVQHKGIGEGRRYFMELFKNSMQQEKFNAHRRNVELLARGLINHVRITDLDGPSDTAPDDVVEFDDMARDYKPRYGTKTVKPKQAVGLFLEAPALHYSVGTRVTPKVVQQLDQYNVPQVQAHEDTPSFAPEMTRAMETLAHSKDWMVGLGGFHLKKSLISATHRSHSSQTHGTSFIPALAQGSEFGKSPTGSAY